jgi:hypothetical protein
MVTVNFEKKGGPLTAKAVFLGDMIANYGMFLKAKKGNDQTLLLEGDNLNPDDDSKQLPGKANSNSGRRLKLQTAFFGNHPDVAPDYEIRLEVHQGGKMIGFNSEKSDNNSKLTDKAQISLLLINLVAQ